MSPLSFPQPHTRCLIDLLEQLLVVVVDVIIPEGWGEDGVGDKTESTAARRV